jgi:hypothetical protein
VTEANDRPAAWEMKTSPRRSPNVNGAGVLLALAVGVAIGADGSGEVAEGKMDAASSWREKGGGKRDEESDREHDALSSGGDGGSALSVHFRYRCTFSGRNRSSLLLPPVVLIIILGLTDCHSSCQLYIYGSILVQHFGM